MNECDWSRCHQPATVQVRKDSRATDYGLARPASGARLLLMCRSHADAFKMAGGEHRIYEALGESE